MKILIVNPNLKPGGAERQLLNIASELLHRGIYVEFLLYQKEGLYIKELESKGAIISSFPVYKHQRGVSIYFKRIKYLNSYTSIGNYSTVLSFLPTCNSICELTKFIFRKKWKLIAGARSFDSSFAKGERYKIHYWLYLLANVVLSNSNNTKHDILKVNKLIKADKIKVIYNYLNINNSYYEIDYIPLIDGKFHIVVPANYGNEKNILSVLESLSLLDPQERNKIRIDWYGVISIDNNDNYIAANQMVEDKELAKIVALHDSTPDIYSIIIQSDVVGLFSLSEGFPNSICEGMMLGKTIISTKVSDLPSIFINTKNILCDSPHPKDIADAFRKLIDYSKEELYECGEKNMLLAKNLFSKNNINSIINILK